MCIRDRADLERKGDGRILNGMVQGGFPAGDGHDDRFLRVGRRPMTAREYFELDRDTPHKPLTCLLVWERDSNQVGGGYWAQYWPHGTRDRVRSHYPRNLTPVGPKCDITGGSWAAMVDLAFLIWIGSGKVEDLEYALWLADAYYRYFHLLYSGDTLEKTKNQGARKWYGTAAGNSRAFYWLLTGSKILKAFVFDHPEFVEEHLRTSVLEDANEVARMVGKLEPAIDPRVFHAEHMLAEADE